MPCGFPGDESISMASKFSPSSRRSVANRSGGEPLSREKRSPSTHSPSLVRAFTLARSAGSRPSAARLRAVTGAGIPGWLSTGASTAGSTAMASAYPPVKHMPTAPTPGPPHSACAWAAEKGRQIHAVARVDEPLTELGHARVQPRHFVHYDDRRTGPRPIHLV